MNIGPFDGRFGKKRLLGVGALVGAVALTFQLPVSQTSSHGLALPIAAIKAHAAEPDAAWTRDNDKGLEAGAEKSPEQENYENLAYPASAVASEQVNASVTAFSQALLRKPIPHNQWWQTVGPQTSTALSNATYSHLSTQVSGRVTTLAVSPTCNTSACTLFVGAAGGGLWRTGNALGGNVQWKQVSSDTSQVSSPTGPYGHSQIPSTAIGSIFFDPNDATGNTVYVGTGEPSGSSDSEAGLGLYKSTDAGNHWNVVPGSVPVASNRAISSVAVDPTNSGHIFIGTAVARHGVSSVNGGRFTPAGAPSVGLYESTDGGQTFTQVLKLQQDAVDPTNPTGNDFFRGGVSKVIIDPLNVTNVYVSAFDYGLYRRAPSLEGGSTEFKQVFAGAGAGAPGVASQNSRTEFALAKYQDNGTWKLRVYLGDAGASGIADFYRNDNANGGNAAGVQASWIKLSSSNRSDPGFSSYNFCGYWSVRRALATSQCSYDMSVVSPPGQPNVVYLAGLMEYTENTNWSNGRAVQRSSDMGVHFTDMTADATYDQQTNPFGNGMHPDQHAMAFVPGTDIGFFGSDGGVVRTSGQFANISSHCTDFPNRGSYDDAHNFAYGPMQGQDLLNCQAWLSAVPTKIDSLNAGLNTLQFQSVAVDPNNANNIVGGTQDNGTHRSFDGGKNWYQTIGGDGGQSGFDAVNGNIHVHSYFNPQHDVNFMNALPSSYGTLDQAAYGWDWISDPLLLSRETSSFYTPLVTDPRVGGTLWDGLQHVWRTKDDGGPSDYLNAHCNEYFGDFAGLCGDWAKVGPDLTGSVFGTDKAGSYVVAITRAKTDASTLWTATRRGRVFVSTNADAEPASAVVFNRIDTAAQPTRFVSGIVIDPANANHAWISYSGYNAYAAAAGQAQGHVFDVTYNPSTQTAQWKDISGDLGEQPITSLAYGGTGSLYAGTDWGVLQLKLGGTPEWTPASFGLPTVAVYGLTFDSKSGYLYAATHGRGIYKLPTR